MNTKAKIFIITATILCVSAPLFATASAGTAPTNLLASVSASIQTQINSLEQEANTLYTTYLSTNGTSSIRLQLGDKSVLVAVLQRALISGGYLKPPATGIFGTSTQAAIEAFQTANRYAVTGYIDISTQSLSRAFFTNAIPFNPVSIGTTGGQTGNFQNFLIKAGYLKIATSTGYFGSLTQAAVKKFQAVHGLPQTGVVDQATFDAMNG